MADRTDLLTITVTKYQDKPFYGRRKLGVGRWAFDMGVWSLIIECWWIR